MGVEDEAGPTDDLAFRRRVTVYLEGDLTPDDVRLLSAELVADARKRATFVSICEVCTALAREGAAIRNMSRLSAGREERPGRGTGQPASPEPAVELHDPGDGQHVARPSTPATDAANALPAGTAALDDAMILPAIWELAPGQPTPPAGPAAAAAAAAAASRPPALAARWPSRRRKLLLGAMAAASALAIALTWAVLPDRRPAVITAVAAATDADGHGVVARRALRAGDSLRLDAGCVEVTFASGAVVVVRAPASFRIVGRNAVALGAGSLCAHVPVDARGFRVTAPGLAVVDMGTNFGVKADPARDGAEVHVFSGTVETTALGPGGSAVGQPVRVTTGRALRRAPDGGAGLVAIPFAPDGFDRDIGKVRMTVAVYGTGEGLAGGANDPHWQVVALSTDPAWRTRPAVVLNGPLGNCAPQAADAEWVSTTSDKGANVLAGNYVFRTTVDLSGLDPATVAVGARAAADDMVADVLVNGVSTGASTPHTYALESIVKTHDLKIRGPWREGKNQVDVVVANLPVVPSKARDFNPMSLQFGWTLTAVPVVRR